MINTELIAKHFKQDYENIEMIKERCKLCGKDIEKGINEKHVIKENFTDYSYLKYKSMYICLDCYTVFQSIIKTEKGYAQLRNFSYYSDNKEFKTIQKKDFKYYIFEHKFSLPFLLVITYNFKKHTGFKSIVNYNNNEFIVTTDETFVKIDRSKVLPIYEIIENWYKVFNKAEILATPKYFNIEKYGIEKYYKENEIIKKYRNSSLFKLLVYILFKEFKNGKD